MMRCLAASATVSILVGSFLLMPKGKADTYVPKGEKERMTPYTQNSVDGQVFETGGD